MNVREHILDGTPQDVVERYESLGQVAAASDFGLLERNVVVVDTETTGLSFSGDELTQIAAARLENGEATDWYVTFVNPGRPISEEITHLTGISEEEVRDAPTPQEAIAGLVKFAGDAIMVAHNVSFDKTFLTRHPEGYPLLENTWIDSLDLSRIALPRLRSHRLIDLVDTFGAPISTHRADDDVAATCVVFRILLAAVTTMPLPLVRYIGTMAPEKEWSTGVVFRMLATLMAGEDAGEAAGEVAGEDHRPNELFSVHNLRKQRVLNLPVITPKKDADDLVGALKYPTVEQIEEAFSATGLLGSIYSNFEPRIEQQNMACAVRDAFETSENLVVEAGTGVGKSMAYLVVGALFAQMNDISVGVATKTNSLLDQLVYQELPALAAALSESRTEQAQSAEQAQYVAPTTSKPFTWAPLKGMAHYPCLRKIQQRVDAGPAMMDVGGETISQAPALAALLSFIEQSDFDDLDGLKINFRSLPRYSITSNSTECLRRKCPFFGKQCFAHGARRRAEGADIVVTNHALLFCDVVADGSLLPPIRHWIIDEAHSAENEARQAFALEVSSEALERLVARIGPAAGGRNLFTRAERAVERAGEEQLTQTAALAGKCKRAAAEFTIAEHDYITSVKNLLFFEPQTRSRTHSQQGYDPVNIWINTEVRESEHFADTAAFANTMIEKADALIKAQQELVAYLEGIDEAAVAQREIAAATLELREIRNAAEVIFGQPSDLYVYQADIARKKDRFSDTVQAQLLSVAEPMNERFFARTHSAVFASATLSVGESFDTFQKALGLGESEFSPVKSLQLQSSYDFDNNMLIYVASDMPEPNDPNYLTELNRLLVAVHRANNGGMLTLFTNRREMEKSFAEVSDQLKLDDLRVVCQRWGVSVKGLRDDFLADRDLSLFATKSFWEGFDAPGATLRGVVIPKLPFGRPTDPLYCERATRDDRAWWHYVLPQAVIETKQAAGRLIRKADDRGVLILADKRLVTKAYGKTFLKSLQSKTVRVATIDEIAAALELMDL